MCVEYLYSTYTKVCTLFYFPVLELKEMGSNSSKSKCSSNRVVKRLLIKKLHMEIRTPVLLPISLKSHRLRGSLTGDILPAAEVILVEAATSVDCEKLAPRVFLLPL